jgi:hypothetical protein
MKTILIFLIIVLAMTSCSLPSIGKAAATPAQPIPPTPLLKSTPTQPPEITQIPTATNPPTPALFVPFDAKCFVDYVNFRSNPGYLFPVISSLAKGTNFHILAKSPGGEWMYGIGPSEIKGWIFAQLLQATANMQEAPIMQPQDAQLVKGKVVNEKGEPISGIQFSIVQGAGQGFRRSDAVTDGNGDFFAYLPTSMQGVWTVSYTAIACTSNVMDSKCLCKPASCGKPDPLITTINLPQNDQLIFTWK